MEARTMIPSQRHLFDLPDDIAYLNCAYMAPLMHSVVEAGLNGVRRKARPWEIAAPDFFSDAARRPQASSRASSTPVRRTSRSSPPPATA